MMGVFRVRVRVFDMKDETQSCAVEMLVDTGSNMAVIPADVVRALKLVPIEFRTFRLADGNEIGRWVGRVGLSVAGRSTVGEVVLGEAGDGAILGAIPLESMGLEVDPRTRQLRPTPQYLMAHGRRRAGTVTSSA